ncbi:response regulator [uncultured Aureimonas sp.]|uniref:response regulator transcription factor n=1 Tax=uncultured Aureimonas sp. TaxID=1604662 RepID=UPI0025DAC4C2|nr:response regulator [uncultured Aureimonas sp.]
MQPEPAVHVVDDDADVLRSVSFLLRAHRIPARMHSSASAFLRAEAVGIAGCVLSDVRMPEMDGIELLRRLRAAGSSLPFIVMTGHADVPLAVEAMKAGAMDFIQKPCAGEALLELAGRGLERWRELSAERARQADASAGIAVLSKRELAVLEEVARGKASKVVAHELGISVRTVEVHRANILAKLGVDNTASAIAKLVASRG